MTNIQISCRTQAKCLGGEHGRAAQRMHLLSLGRAELRLEAAASAEGRGLDASAVPLRWRTVYKRSFFRAGLTLKRH